MTSNETRTKRRTTVRGAWPSAIVENFHEVPEANPRELGAWVYTDQLSYAPGDVIRLHVSTTASAYDLRIYRDGAVETEVCTWQALPGRCHPTPADASVNGCGWPAALDQARRGSGMIAYFERGKGSVFNAGSCEWVSGLIEHDPFVERLTRNVLIRFTQGLPGRRQP